jgi:hypothetical protein
VTQGNAQSPSHTHRGVHRSISATNAKPSRRASSGGETLRESQQQQQGTATGGGLSFHMFVECSVTPCPLPDAFIVIHIYIYIYMYSLEIYLKLHVGNSGRSCCANFEFWVELNLLMRKHADEFSLI